MTTLEDHVEGDRRLRRRRRRRHRHVVAVDIGRDDRPDGRVGPTHVEQWTRARHASDDRDTRDVQVAARVHCHLQTVRPRDTFDGRGEAAKVDPVGERSAIHGGHCVIGRSV